MRVGLVGFWFNRGLAQLARHLRSALDDLGHDTRVLALPAKDDFVRPRFVAGDDVWDQDGVTWASTYRAPIEEYLAFVESNGIELLFCHTNLQFAELAELRRRGVRVVGWIEWESLTRDMFDQAIPAYDELYSLTAAEQERYRSWGYDSPRIRWGCHPELLAIEPTPSDPGLTTFYYPGGYFTPRKPTVETVAAFLEAAPDDARLLLRSQVPRSAGEITGPSDPRLQIVQDDLPTAEHLGLLAGSSVMLAPSRWEGLGLHFFEAAAFGLPVITNEAPPMDELVHDGRNGLLVPSRVVGEAPSGIPAVMADHGDLVDAIRRLCDPAERERLAAGSRAVREELSWERTVDDVEALVARAVPAPRSAAPIDLAVPTTKRASIVIPLHGRVDLTERCLVRLIEHTDESQYELVIVDNASPDDTPALLDRLEGDLVVVRNEENLGFARACNQGAEAASGRHLVFLNNDTEPGPRWLEPLLDALDAGEADVVGSRLLFPDGTVQHAGIEMVRGGDAAEPIVPRHVPPSGVPADDRLATRRRAVAAVTGACLAVSRELFWDLGGFSERYWNGHEDVDLCCRVRWLGGTVLYEPASTLVHHESQSGPERYRRHAENRALFQRRWAHRIEVTADVPSPVG